MSATDRAKSVVTSDGTIYTAETSDADGNTIFSMEKATIRNTLNQ